MQQRNHDFRFNRGAVAALLASSAILTLAGCQGASAPGPKATATLESRSGSTAKGVVTFTRQGNEVVVNGTFTGLKPNGEHGIHVHEKGDCSAPDAASAGGHFNPGAKAHGMPGSGMNHAGDMPNIKADASGNATYTTKVSWFTIDTGATGIIGKGVVVHRDPDDYKSQPAGNSGPRIACGVIQ